MKSLVKTYLASLVIPYRLISVISQVGGYYGRQKLYKQQASEMLENLRKVAGNKDVLMMERNDGKSYGEIIAH